MKTPALAAALLMATAAAADAAALSQTGNSTFLVSIEADKVIYSDKDVKAVYSGNVVVFLGVSRLMCSGVTLSIEKRRLLLVTSMPAVAPSGGVEPTLENSQLRHMDCQGPVAFFSKTRTATGDSAIFDTPTNKLVLTGNVTVTTGRDVTKGGQLIYDVATEHATVVPGNAEAKTRVRSRLILGLSMHAK